MESAQWAWTRISAWDYDSGSVQAGRRAMVGGALSAPVVLDWNRLEGRSNEGFSTRPCTCPAGAAPVLPRVRRVGRSRLPGPDRRLDHQRRGVPRAAAVDRRSAHGRLAVRQLLRRQHRLCGGGAGAQRRAPGQDAPRRVGTPTMPTSRPGSTTSSRRRSTTRRTTGSPGTKAASTRIRPVLA